MENATAHAGKPEKSVLVVYIVLSFLAALAAAAAVASDIAGLTLLYEKGAPQKIAKHVLLYLAAQAAMSFPFAARRLGLGVPPAPHILFMSFTFLHLIPGDILRMYDHPTVLGLKTGIFDKLVHVAAGSLLFMAGLSLVRAQAAGDIFQPPPFLSVLSAACFSLAALCAWELFEFFFDTVAASNLQRWQDGFATFLIEGERRLAELYGQGTGLIDTMADLSAGLAGALAVAAAAYALLKKKSRKVYGMLIIKA